MAPKLARPDCSSPRAHNRHALAACASEKTSPASTRRHKTCGVILCRTPGRHDAETIVDLENLEIDSQYSFRRHCKKPTPVREQRERQQISTRSCDNLVNLQHISRSNTEDSFWQQRKEPMTVKRFLFLTNKNSRTTLANLITKVANKK